MGGYASFSTEINRWAFIAGLRGEYTRTANESDRIKRDYFDLFPSLSATYAFNNLKTWMLVGQYTRNIERPAFYAQPEPAPDLRLQLQHRQSLPETDLYPPFQHDPCL